MIFLKNYTSDVPVSTTIGRIEKVLIQCGVYSIEKEYGTQAEIVAIRFRIKLIDREVAIRIPCDRDKALEALWLNYVDGDKLDAKGDRIEDWGSRKRRTKADFAEQAERTAWRIMQDWIEVQMSMVDVVCGGFPCKGISLAGDGTGLDHEESGLWVEQRRIIGEVRPRIVFIENTPALTFRGGVSVIGALAQLGYDCRWGIISAADAIWSFGDPCLDHLRERIWIYGEISDRNGARCTRQGQTQSEGRRRYPFTSGSSENSDARRALLEGRASRKRNGGGRTNEQQFREANGNSEISGERAGLRPQESGRERRGRSCDSNWWSTEPRLGRVAHGVAHRVDRLEAIGDGQVPAVVRLAWETLKP